MNKRLSPFMLPLYLRREPTTDPLRERYKLPPRCRDVVAYRDPAATEPAGRWPWHYSKPQRSARTVMLNCWRWRAVWLADLETSA